MLHSPGHHVDTITYNSTLSAVSDRGGRDGKDWEWSGLLLAALRERELRSDVIGYTAAITSCELASLWFHAAALLAEMLDQRTRVDSLSVSLVTSACQKTGSWQQALYLLHDQRAQQQPVNILTYNLAMAACLDSGEWQHALALFRTLRCEGVSDPCDPWNPNAITYSFCLDACENGGQLKDSPLFSHDLACAGLQAVRASWAGAPGRKVQKASLATAVCDGGVTEWLVAGYPGISSLFRSRTAGTLGASVAALSLV